MDPFFQARKQLGLTHYDLGVALAAVECEAVSERIAQACKGATTPVRALKSAAIESRSSASQLAPRGRAPGYECASPAKRITGWSCNSLKSTRAVAIAMRKDEE